MQVSAAAPSAGVIRGSTIDRLTGIAAQAVDGLTPVVVINRRIDTALQNVGDDAATPFSTIHTSPAQDAVTAVRRTSRAVIERARGTHGEGDDAGRTVFGSVRFVAADDAAAGADAVLTALQAQGDPGVRAYGPVSLVANPQQVNQRTTIASDDTGATLARVRELDELPHVIAERLKRSNGTSGSTVKELLTLPPASAQQAVRNWLLSDALAKSDSYIEAQIRRVAPNDLLGSVIDARAGAQVVRRPAIDPGASPSQAQVDALMGALQRHGIPAHVRSGSDA